ncbi:heme-binding domain-containing protein [Formosa sp. PL04]|uniref:heme-binding domain-containing protein n=1 Tax=Formosa sp. PL04 TaxID=3081755 RepID=UPI002980B96E|nr:heme-binding domain-containing protein [Formosa sp. PL04]MDW5289820.1 heme-binding domain-containing protein [Formosa sp. PL04]
MKTLKKILILLFVVFIIAQFFGPEKNTGDLTSVEPFLTETNPPEHVAAILKESCYDCHSSHTRYPWYNNLTPVNYWMAEHVNDGKKHFDFSKWESYSVKKKDHKFEELIEMVVDKEMPLESYTWAHSEAKLSDSDIESIKEWAENVRIKLTLIPKPE